MSDQSDKSRRRFMAIAGSLVAGLGLQHEAFANKVASLAESRRAVASVPPLIAPEMMEGLSYEEQDLLVSRVIRSVLSEPEAQAILEQLAAQHLEDVRAL